MADAFPEPWIDPFGIFYFVLADNGQQFVGKLSAILCTNLGFKHLTTTACHPQTSSQAKRLNPEKLTRLQYYVASGQQSWNAVV